VSASPPPPQVKPSQPPVAIDALLSFLKETKGVFSWSTKDLADTLKLSRAQAAEVLTLLRAQGYVQAESGKSDQWLTTTSGETVSGSKLFRFNPEKVRQALASLQQAIEENNKNKNSQYKITRAVAFGDFLKHASSTVGKVQAADVGIELTPRSSAADNLNSAPESAAKSAFLHSLRAKSAQLKLHPFAPWMSSRSHLNLLSQ
jgi:DNA-binding transcriptional MocR family regulator